MIIGRDLPQREDGQGQCQHAETTHQRSVAVIRRQHCTDFVITDDRQVDEEAEHTRPDEVPEPDRDQEVERPLVRNGDRLPAHLTSTPGQFNEVPRVECE